MEYLTVYEGELVLSEEVSKTIADLERMASEIKKKQDEMKKAILEEMEAKNVVKLDNDILTITYIATTDRETFDSKKFKTDNPDLYDEYVKISPVKPSVRIKVKA